MIMIENKRTGSGQNIEVMMRRFFREVQQNRILSEAKKRRYKERKITRTEKRVLARRKAYIKKLKRGY